MTLPTRTLGSTELEITRVGLGAWAIGGGGWAFGCRVRKPNGAKLEGLKYEAR